MCVFSMRIARLLGIQQGIELSSLELLTICFKEILVEDRGVYII